MKIEFYHSAFCPRCRMAARALEKIQAIFPKLEIESIEVTTHPLVTLRAGIRMFPAIKINNAILSGFLLPQTKMQDFIATQINIQSTLDEKQISLPK